MKKFWSEFKEFAVKGNAVDLAVGVIVGAAFTGIINSLVKDVIMPPISNRSGLRGVSGSVECHRAVFGRSQNYELV